MVQWQTKKYKTKAGKGYLINLFRDRMDTSLYALLSQRRTGGTPQKRCYETTRRSFIQNLSASPSFQKQ